MFSFKLIVTALIIKVLQAQENGPEYINIAAGESPFTFVHPELPAGINDGGSCISTLAEICFLHPKFGNYCHSPSFYLPTHQ
jgi:hypothetical protein